VRYIYAVSGMNDHHTNVRSSLNRDIVALIVNHADFEETCGLFALKAWSMLMR
jgi:hypothetical protein